MPSLSLQTGGFGFAPALPKLDNSQTLADLKPLSFTGGMQSPISFKPLPAWQIPNAHPELVAQGIEKGVMAASALVLEGYNKKDAVEVKKEELALKKELRLAELAEKLEEKRALIEERQNDPLRLLGIDERNLRIDKLNQDKQDRIDSVLGDASSFFKNKSEESSSQPVVNGQNADLPTGDPAPETSPSLFAPEVKDQLDEFSNALNQNPLSQIKPDSFDNPAYSRDFKPSIFAENIFANINNAPKVETQQQVYDLSNIDPKYLMASTGAGITPPAEIPLKAPAFDLNFDPRSDVFNVIPEGIPFTTVEKKRSVTSPVIVPTSVAPSQGLAEMNFPSTQMASRPASATTAPAPVAPVAQARKAPRSGFINTPEEAESEALRAYDGYQSKGKIEYHKDVINPVASQMAGRPIKGVWEVKRDPLSEADLQKQKELNLPRPPYDKEQGDYNLSLRKALVADPMYASARELSKKKTAVEAGLEDHNGFGDIAAINAFQKMIDEGVAVREGDVELIRSSQAFFAKYSPEFLKDKGGLGKILTEADENSMKRMASKLTLLSKKAANREAIPFYKDAAISRGLRWEPIAADFDTTPTKDEVDAVMSGNRDAAAALEGEKIKIGSKDPAATKRIDAKIQNLLAASKSILQEYTKGQK